MKNKKLKLTRKELAQFVTSGWTDTRIGLRYGVSRQAVAQMRWKCQIPSNLKKLEKRNREIIALYESGTTGPGIQKIYKLSLSQIYRILDQAKNAKKTKRV